MPRKYFQIDGMATLSHHRGQTTLPGRPPDTTQGSTIVCLHDAGGNGNEFSDLMDALGESHSPMSFDQPGHGRSGGLDSLGTIDAMAEHAESFVSELGLSSVVLIGEGMGSAVAIAMAARSKVNVAGIVAVGAVATSYELDEEIEQLAAITAGRARRQFDQTGYGPDTERSVYGTAFQEWVKTDPRATVNDRRGQAAWMGEERATAVSCRVLVVIGEHQEEPYRVAAEGLVSALPNGSGADLPGAGRHGVIEQPVALGSLIGSFCSELGATR